MNDTTSRTERERSLLELIGFAIISARNLLDETPDYGPIRLLEVADRLIGSCVVLGVDLPAWTADLPARIRAGGRVLAEGPEAFRLLLDELVASVIGQMLED
ncbi:DUF6092 family protein [Candidatus Bipolaricaulota bacterium]